MPDFDVIVLGAGIAGVSAAAAISKTARVLVLEAETSPGYHATGRSAAYFAPGYGNAVVREMTQASSAFFNDAGSGFADVPLLRPRDALWFADADRAVLVDKLAMEINGTKRLSGSEVLERLPILRPECATAGLLAPPGGGDIDVDALLQGWVRQLRSNGGVLQTGTRVESLERRGGHWHVGGAGMAHSASVIINAAGAWADDIAALAGAVRQRLEPRRRTALLLAVPSGVPFADWPLALDIEENLYFKPEAGMLMVSPGDETPCAASDVQPEELDIAIALDRFERAATMPFDRPRSPWAGLRTFAPDRTPVVGFDPVVPGFYWLAGQGGYGVQTAPAMAALVAHDLAGSDGAAFDPAITVRLRPRRY
jgi:D-arginine dehydrogenase